MENENRKYGWFLVIPTMCGDSFCVTTEDDGTENPTIYKSEAEVNAEITDANEEMLASLDEEELASGEDYSYDWFPQYGYVSGDYIYYLYEGHVIDRVNWRASR